MKIIKINYCGECPYLEERDMDWDWKKDFSVKNLKITYKKKEKIRDFQIFYQ